MTWQDDKIQTNELSFTFLILIPLKLHTFLLQSQNTKERLGKFYSHNIPIEERRVQ